MNKKIQNRDYEQELLNLRSRLEEIDSPKEPAMNDLDKAAEKYSELFEDVKDNLSKKVEQSFMELKLEIQSLRSNQSNTAFSDLNEFYMQIFNKVTTMEEIVTKSSASQNTENVMKLLGDIVFLQNNISGVLTDVKNLLGNFEGMLKKDDLFIGDKINLLEAQVKNDVFANFNDLKKGLSEIIKFILSLDKTIKDGQTSIKQNINSIGSDISNKLGAQIGSVREGLTEIIKFLIFLSEQQR
ncbi:hypothetical protein MCHI_000023 [Candidatus Magnetoovum chiemensis]|nr:hypothetical protein MCHI_000023 [Candidatus Magnetoovum chiemensis]